MLLPRVDPGIPLRGGRSDNNPAVRVQLRGYRARVLPWRGDDDPFRRPLPRNLTLHFALGMHTTVNHEKLLDVRIAAVSAASTAAAASALAARLVAGTSANVAVMVLLYAFSQVEEAAKKSRLAHAEIFARHTVVAQDHLLVRGRRYARLATAFSCARATRCTAGACRFDHYGAVGKADPASHQKNQRRGAESCIKLLTSHFMVLHFLHEVSSLNKGRHSIFSAHSFRDLPTPSATEGLGQLHGLRTGLVCPIASQKKNCVRMPRPSTLPGMTPGARS